MASRIEVEEKYFVQDIKDLENIIDLQGFKLISEYNEIDEYFTDIDSLYIENRTCLRLRNTNGKNLELTFKGKSNEFLNSYSKVEQNIEMEVSQYDDMVNLLNKLGYYSYSVVNKKRKTYTKEINDLEYNIMIDIIENIGCFVEFEILSNDLNVPLEYLNKEIKSFISNFKNLNLEVANLPYRDFVSNYIFSQIKPKNKLTTILCDLDGTLINSENIFFDAFKHTLKDMYSIDISFKEYEENELNRNSNLINKLKKENKIPNDVLEKDIMKIVYNNYLNKFKELIKNDYVYLNFALLKRIKEKGIRIGLVSTSKREFIELILTNLKLDNLFDIIISREDVINLKPDPEAYLKALKTMNVKPDECIAIEDSYRGIKASCLANIKTIKVNEYSKNNKNLSNDISIDKISRLLLILINNL